MLRTESNKKKLLKQIELVKKNIMYYSKVYSPKCKKVKGLLKKLRILEKEYEKI